MSTVKFCLTIWSKPAAINSVLNMFKSDLFRKTKLVWQGRLYICDYFSWLNNISVFWFQELLASNSTMFSFRNILKVEPHFLKNNAGAVNAILNSYWYKFSPLAPGICPDRNIGDPYITFKNSPFQFSSQHFCVYVCVCFHVVPKLFVFTPTLF